MEDLLTLAAVGWDPEIRGVLVVITGSVVLFGSVWLILSTNSGIRVGTLLAFAGFFSWMTMMGAIWWIYGTGWVGDAPAWEIVDVNRGDLNQASVDEARDLPPRSDLPNPAEVAQNADSETIREEFVTLPDRESEENAVLTDEEFADVIETAELRDSQVTFSQLAAADRSYVDSLGLDFGGWNLLSTAESGDAQAVAGAFVVESDAFEFEGANEFTFLEAYDIGGKPSLPDDPNRWDRIYRWVANSLHITHPTHYAVVQLQAVTPASLESVPGEPPPVPVADTDEPVISVIMVRDLGNLRLRPALVTIGSAAFLAVFIYLLHVRDKELMARRDEFEKSH